MHATEFNKFKKKESSWVQSQVSPASSALARLGNQQNTSGANDSVEYSYPNTGGNGPSSKQQANESRVSLLQRNQRLNTLEEIHLEELHDSNTLKSRNQRDQL